MTDNVKITAIIGIVLIAAVIAGAVIKSQGRKIDELEKRYELSIAAQKGSEQALQALKETNAGLIKTLETWKREYAEITKQNQEAKNEISGLEKQNAAIADILHGIIPDELWDSMFHKAGNGLHNQD